MTETMKPGLFTLIQDEGRWGYQAYGMPVAGAMDRYAYRVANILAGNRRGAAALEMTMQGGTFKFAKKCLVSVGGADMQARVNGREVPSWSAFYVPAGGVLSFDAVLTGCRTYLAVHGGFEAPRVLGSRSTYTRANVGGMDGRPLKEGDLLSTGRDVSAAVVPLRLPEQFVPRHDQEITLRVILGPQDDMFTSGGVGTLLASQYTISHEADRMGYRLEGPKIEHVDKADIISDALPLGAVQVPAHGMPIVMMADRQTTGGYAKIATVIGPDLSLLAQGKPGDTVRFSLCADEEAVEALRREEQCYEEIQAFLASRQSSAPNPLRSFNVFVDGVYYDVRIQEEI
jgi:antagonist of KipI